MIQVHVPRGVGVRVPPEHQPSPRASDGTAKALNTCWVFFISPFRGIRIVDLLIRIGKFAEELIDSKIILTRRTAFWPSQSMEQATHSILRSIFRDAVQAGGRADE